MHHCGSRSWSQCFIRLPDQKHQRGHFHGDMVFPNPLFTMDCFFKVLPQMFLYERRSFLLWWRSFYWACFCVRADIFDTAWEFLKCPTFYLHLMFLPKAKYFYKTQFLLRTVFVTAKTNRFLPRPWVRFLWRLRIFQYRWFLLNDHTRFFDKYVFRASWVFTSIRNLFARGFLTVRANFYALFFNLRFNLFTARVIFVVKGFLPGNGLFAPFHDFCWFLV